MLGPVFLQRACQAQQAWNSMWGLGISTIEEDEEEEGAEEEEKEEEEEVVVNQYSMGVENQHNF